MMGWAALLEKLTLRLATSTGWSRSEIHGLSPRQLLRNLKHLQPKTT